MTLEDYLSAFPHTYQAEALDQLPNTKAPTIHFPGASEKEGKDGLLISVRPNRGSPWIGIFGFGGGGGAVTALCSTPDPNRLFVVSRGAGYFVAPDNPGAWSQVHEIFPITAVRPAREHEMVVLADDTSVAAFGVSGLLWKTSQISFDGVTITNIGTEFIEGEGWDPTTTTPAKFRIDIRTGEHEGGASPEKYRT